MPFNNFIIGILILFTISFVIAIFSNPYEVTKKKIENAKRLIKDHNPNAAIQDINVAIQNIKLRDDLYSFFIKTPQLILGRKVPSLEKAYFIRGFANYQRGYNHVAISDYTKAINLKPDYIDAYYGRGVSKGVLRNKYGACKDWKKAESLGGNRSSRLIEQTCY